MAKNTVVVVPVHDVYCNATWHEGAECNCPSRRPPNRQAPALVPVRVKTGRLGQNKRYADPYA